MKHTVLPMLLRFYASRGLRIVKGEAQYVWDDKGRRYLDLHTGYGAAFLGHRNPYVVEELKRQLDEIMTLSVMFETPVREEALKLLASILPKHLWNIYLLNSGTEAVELAIKIVMRATKRRKFVALMGAFHGRTLGSLSLTWNPRYREPFQPLPLHVEYIKPNDLSVIDKVVDDNTAAVFIEPVLGEGGVIPLSREFLASLYQRCKEVNAYFVVDEIQTGFGRTGLLWAYEVANIKPDIMVAGKAIGGGFPLSLVAVTDELANKLRPGDHGSTFGGNPLAFAALKGAIRALLSDNVVYKARTMGEQFIDRLVEALQNHRLVRDIRGRGLMIGVELRKEPGKVIQCMQEHGVIVLKAGVTVVRMLPPYLITRDDVDKTIEVLSKCLGEIQ